MFRFLLVIALALTSIPAASQPQSGLLMTTDELAKILKDPVVVVLHVADRASAFEDAHIPGARFLRYGDFAVEGADAVGSELPPIDQVKRIFEAVGVSNNSRVVLYASSPVTASRAFFTLDAMGHTRVAILDGGFAAWRDEGRPIETGPATAARPGQFSPVLNASRVATAQLIQAQMANNGIAFR